MRIVDLFYSEKMSLELRLIIDLCSLFWNPEKKGLLVLDEKIDYEKVLKLATHHRVKPLVYHGLQHVQEELQFPKEVLATLERACKSITFRNLQLTAKMVQLVSNLQELGIPVLPYKGSVLAVDAFGDLSNRAFNDIDILIKLEDYDKVRQYLIDQNYETENIPDTILKNYFKHHCEIAFRTSTNAHTFHEVDVHWLFGQRMDQLDFSLDDIQNFTKSVQQFGLQFTSLNADGNLILTALHHGGKERWRRLKEINDITAILNQFQESLDWDCICDTAKQWKVENLVWASIGMADFFYDVVVPDKIRDKINQPSIQRIVKQHIGRILEQEDYEKFATENVFGKIWFHIKIRKSWLIKFKVIWYNILLIFTPNKNDFSGLEISSLAYFKLVIFKPIRLWNKFIQKKAF